MRAFFKGKDGGPESTVTGYWLVEMKRLLSVALVRFDGQSREAFHTHAFDAVSWVLRGSLTETFIDGRVVKHKPSLLPFVTKRSDFHKVDSDAPVSWAITFRGPWVRKWREFIPASQRFLTLTSGRKIVEQS